MQVAEREDVGFYDIEELDELSQWGVIDVRAGVDRRVPAEETQSGSSRPPTPASG